MRVFFGYTQNAAVAWYRFVSFVKPLRKLGVDIAMFPYDHYDTKLYDWQNNLNDPETLAQLENAFKTCDVTLFGYFRNIRALALLQAAKEKYGGKQIGMEIDDYIQTLPGYNVAHANYAPGSDQEWIVIKQMELSDFFVFSTKELERLYAPYIKGRPAYVIPNGVDRSLWPSTNVYGTRKNEKLRFGFTGSPNHVGDIRLIKGPILDALKRWGDVEFYFSACCPEFLKGIYGITLDERWTTVDKFPEMIREFNFDVAIAPLCDNNFNRGKSNLRYLEMSMLGTPVIASDGPSYGGDIVDGKTGLLCRTEQDWMAAFERLRDPEARAQMGSRARKYVIGKYDVDDIAKAYKNALVHHRGGRKR